MAATEAAAEATQLVPATESHSPLYISQSLLSLAMHLVQLLLPTRDNQGRPYPEQLFGRLRKTLVDHFGGLTAYVRAPAKGHWQDHGQTQIEDVVVLEVMVAELDRAWWRKLRKELESDLGQQEMIIRCQPLEKL